MKIRYMLIGLLFVQSAYCTESGAVDMTLNIQSFANVVADVKLDAFANVSLSQLDSSLASGTDLHKTVSDSTYGYTFSVDVSAAKGTADLMFYMPDSGYTKLGENYSSAMQKIAAVAAKLGFVKKSVQADGEPADDDREVGWAWVSGGYNCQLIINSADYYGGDVLYECTK